MILINAQIALVLLLWIIASFGYGRAVMKLCEKYTYAYMLNTHSILKIFTSFILGVLFLCLLTQVLNFFIPINTPVAWIILGIGIGLCIYTLKHCRIDMYFIISACFAFCISASLSFLSDSIGFDSVNYHIQIVTWIQQSPIIFGLGNIHGRLGFNGIIYNFYALSDVGLIFPTNRSFIGNEIVFFGFLLCAFYILIKRDFTRFSSLFLVCSLLPFPCILTWVEFQALYCEGIGAVLGILVFALLLFFYEENIKRREMFYLCFVISIGATMIKIANVALVFGTILCFITLFKKDIFKKDYIKSYITLGFTSLVLVLPWALKGMMTTGMIAYPASVFYIESLPWAVSEAQRANEVCWIMSWARSPRKPCAEVLASHAWMWDFFTMKTPYFEYFKYFVWTFFATISIFIVFRILAFLGISMCLKNKLIHISANRVGYISIFCAMICGIIFWFLSGPDPRFGMVYIIPLVAFLLGINLSLAYSIKQPFLHYAMLALFVASIYPLFLLGRPAFVIVWTLLLLLLFIPYRIYLPLFLVASIYSVPNLYRKSFEAMKEVPKIRPIFIEEKQTDFGVNIFVRRDEPNENTQTFSYEPRPSGPYFNENVQKVREKTIFGRKAYTIKD